MEFIGTVPKRDEIMKAAVVRAVKTASQVNERRKIDTIKSREIMRVRLEAQMVSEKLEKLVKTTVNFNELPPFQLEMANAIVDMPAVKRALHSCGWAGRMIDEIGKNSVTRLKHSSSEEDLTRIRKNFDGRAESIIKKIGKDLDLLEDAKKKLHTIPNIHAMPSIIIAGFPNVGKSSLLNALTGSDVEVASYPFTTQKILIGIMKSGYKQVQFIDTPGLLDRPLSDRNRIEMQAIAAIKHITDKCIFIIDPEPSCGYEIDAQVSLLKQVQKDFGLDMLVVVNKADIATREQLEETAAELAKAKVKVHGVVAASCVVEGGVDALQAKIATWALK